MNKFFISIILSTIVAVSVILTVDTWWLSSGRFISIIYLTGYFTYIIIGSYTYYMYKILKLSFSLILSILIFAVFSNLVWLFEVLIKDWTGLIWLNYFHVSLVIILLFYNIWLLVINKLTKIESHNLFYNIVYIVFFILSTLIFLSLFKDYNKPDFINVYTFLLIILEFFIIILSNIIISRKEKINLSKKLFKIIIIPIIIIPAVSILINSIIEFYNIPNEYWPNEGMKNDPIHWIKTGGIIFAFILYECAFICYIKNNKKEAMWKNDKIG
jgi:hypothetical protein